MAVTYSQNGVIVRQADINYRIIGGKEYRTVVMPDGKEWLAENLDYKFATMSTSQSLNNPYHCYCNNDESTWGWNGRKCGLLYNYSCVTYLNDHSEVISGWHVPTKSEYETLLSSIGASTAGLKLKAKPADVPWADASWQGSDDYGFSALPAGKYLYSPAGQFMYIGEWGFFWCGDDLSGDNWELQLGTTNDEGYFYKISMDNFHSLRLVRDAS